MIDQTKLPNNREDWLEMVKLWKESGLTKEAFCREMSIKSSQFSYYCKIYREQNKSRLNFAEIKTAPSTTLSLKLCGQHELTIPPDFDEPTLLRLLSIANKVQ
ncbi:hypothetical protein PsalMR5_04709 (plasmid) [Piscirickettsia salmonis]|uniref:IS66 family insertion sequence element accessory protein TnpA n=2 Tax=Piscirickettsia salmonis TaxID=1238 RepID=UPI0012BAE27E|nr:hypothetical protein [Piscirickettsia salmonis]QGP53446.1 hypothetical protein PsalSR1_00858 [Piscirickettsia salmonis]QGP53833.1 hypothetical protein PsalSR1_01257 [Piscirickettsia salmonis]QGP53963.1 hypothetical protein PsalSR1_01388 [Piscirickettsia salmonis]QGP54086.1 hypothetical protein PsalSR1_01516 [Piscirickettsia salmonis]QGP54417.1 hypothetical protein PsalSR1_01852 [Piscirickettsia salmonis]